MASWLVFAAFTAYMMLALRWMTGALRSACCAGPCCAGLLGWGCGWEGGRGVGALLHCSKQQLR